mmetsp:Transcript_7347/g.8833  ORF Transcript_7347/g.8833 Transcript_7347/m.8833 type:complete len:179 (+) Transcript_7347:357-893(+)|eukprot:CAMPEP_0170471196 /NCGR_PEP_ID=MMETSP0123-20130129/13478_1 /TAXON_ID=182087 /ORGANISM="Favella ehrenbergii, Strain Fehren 1" /LENGTH=178 /DNA_ID=CAMNT_0010738727 /DNA_START=329 /DNA_END=865 /DNA_ORIENTATION=+
MTTATSCDWLDKKHTIFGKIQGETIYNLVKISELEVDSESDRPICDPVPRIERALVLENPFDDIIPRQLKTVPKQATEAPVVKKKTFASKALKNKNLISFADDEDEDGDDGQNGAVLIKRKGIRASHEVNSSAKGVAAQKIISDEQLASLRKKREQNERAKQDLAAKIKQAQQAAAEG